MKKTVPLHLTNGIPGAQAFIVSGINMAARPERKAHIEKTTARFRSFLRHHGDDLEVNWLMYFKASDEIREDMTEILLAAGILSLREFQNLRICDAETQERFFGPTIGEARLFFNGSLPDTARQFKEKKGALQSTGTGAFGGLIIVQMTQQPVYHVLEDFVVIVPRLG